MYFFIYIFTYIVIKIVTLIGICNQGRRWIELDSKCQNWFLYIIAWSHLMDTQYVS